MANEFLGLGITLGYNTVAAPTVYTTLPGITNVDIPSVLIDDVEVSALDSPAKEYIPGLGDGGEITVNVNMRKATAGSAPYVAAQGNLEAYAGDGIVHGFKYTLPGTTTVTYTFSGYVKEFKITASGTSSPATASVKIKVTGAVVKV